MNFLNTRCRPEVDTISELFSRVGYRTMLLNQPCMRKLFCDVNQSLRHVDDTFDTDQEFLAALHRRRDENVLAVIHVCDVHDPLVKGGDVLPDPTHGLDWELFLRLVYNASPAGPDTTDVVRTDGQQLPYANLQAVPPGDQPGDITRHLRMLYQAYLYGVNKFDRFRFKTLIDGIRAAGAWDNTLLTVFSDHGETQFWDYPWRLMHGALTDETAIRVPLMMKIPGVPAGQRDHLVGLVDLLPTIAELTGLEIPTDKLDGRSLMPTIQQNQPAADEYWIENWSHEPDDQDPHIICRAIRRVDGRKYVWNGTDISWDQLDAITPEQYENYAARVTYGNPPSDWLRGQIRQLVQQSDRQSAIRALLNNCRPPYIIFDNVDQDLTENNGVLVDPSHARWSEYQQYQQKMRELTATPNICQPGPDTDEAQLKDRLAQLGYI
ncbi:MAG: sulfatase-like hydrolase/transferase [Planctomycetota bacterium]